MVDAKTPQVFAAVRRAGGEDSNEPHFVHVLQSANVCLDVMEDAEVHPLRDISNKEIEEVHGSMQEVFCLRAWLSICYHHSCPPFFVPQAGRACFWF